MTALNIRGECNWISECIHLIIKRYSTNHKRSLPVQLREDQGMSMKSWDMNVCCLRPDGYCTGRLCYICKDFFLSNKLTLTVTLYKPLILVFFYKVTL